MCGSQPPPFYYAHKSAGQNSSESTEEWLKQLEKTAITLLGLYVCGPGHLDFLHSQPWMRGDREIEKADPVSPLEDQVLN